MKEIMENNKIKFVIAEAPKDITLEQLLKQCDRIKPNWCACGIKSIDNDYPNPEIDIIIDYDNIYKTSDDVFCDIKEVK